MPLRTDLLYMSSNRSLPMRKYLRKGNGRWRLTNSLVANTPMLTTYTSGASSRCSYRPVPPLRKYTVCVSHLDLLVLLSQPHPCPLMGECHTPSESHAHPAKLQKAEHTVPELRQKKCPRTCPTASRVERTDSVSAKTIRRSTRPWKTGPLS